MEYEIGQMEQKHYTVEQLRAILNLMDFSDYNSVAINKLNGVSDTDFKYIRLGVYSSNDDEDDWHRSTDVWCHIPNCDAKFDTVFAYENHYNAQHRYLCTQCHKQLPSAHLLDLHLSERHDSFFAVQAERKPMFACYLEKCLHKSSSAEERRDHCISQHKFPHDFRFDAQPKKKTGCPHGKNTKKKAAGGSAPSAATVHNEAPKTPDASSLSSTHRQSMAPPHGHRAKDISFGHGQTKTFLAHSPSYAKRLARNKGSTRATDVLEDGRMVVDLLESLPN